MNNKSLTGIIWIIIFCLTSVLADGIVRYVSLEGLPSSEILFIRSFLGTLLLLPFVLKNKFLRVDNKTFKLYIFRGVFAFVSVAIWFHILKYTDFTSLVAIGFTAPLFTAILSILLLKEKTNYIKVTSLIVGFIGAMVVIDPIGVAIDWYLLFGLISSFLWAASLIIMKKISYREHPITVAFFLTLVLTPLSFLLSVSSWQWPTPNQYFLIIIFTIFSTIGHAALSYAFSKADISTLMPFEFSQLIFAAIFSYIVFGNMVTLNAFLGGVIILGSGYIILRTEHKKHIYEELKFK